LGVETPLPKGTFERAAPMTDVISQLLPLPPRTAGLIGGIDLRFGKTTKTR
jgi:hypothetical protein